MTYYDSHSCGQYKLIEDIIMKRSIVIRKILRIFVSEYSKSELKAPTSSGKTSYFLVGHKQTLEITR